jgi:hypothetical protein
MVSSGADSAIPYGPRPLKPMEAASKPHLALPFSLRSKEFFRKAQKCAVTSRVTPLKHAGNAGETPHPAMPYPLGN